MKEANLKFTRFNNWVWRNLPGCREIVKIVTASMDGRLSWREWVLMKVHLFSCDSCVNFLKQVTFIRTALRHSEEKLDRENSDIRLSDESRRRLKEKLRFES
ncbi:MAG TPA: zf-HC2 domain-containing protein [Pyrinomonadaceae bacterium]|nr:zf-HC2 domain-containing protein [Pyrinomonadaceae bacterium]